MFNKILVANRGAIAARVLRTLRHMGIRSVAVYSEADSQLPYLAHADEAFCIKGDARASYLNQDALLQIVQQTGADGVHPGYGFLAENARFAQRVHAAGAGFIGPHPQWIDAMGHKTRARQLMATLGMPMCASSGLLPEGDAEVLATAQQIGYPVLVKPAGGGGGIGMLPASDDQQLLKAVTQARSVAQRSFGSAELYLERLVQSPRHIEFQILADRHGSVRHVFERDCSVQRRHQKVIEEAPAPRLPRAWLDQAAAHTAKILEGIGYDVIGTVETLNDGTNSFQFLEVNTRLQVEHAVTEAVTGIDLVEAQIRLAAGQKLGQVLPHTLSITGHAIEARIYAEDPVRFFPSPGKLEALELPLGQGVRVETGYAAGNSITPYYDPLIAKLIVHADDREAAIGKLHNALSAAVIKGVKTNIPFLLNVLEHDEFKEGNVHTGLAATIQQQQAAQTKAVAAAPATP